MYIVDRNQAKILRYVKHDWIFNSIVLSKNNSYYKNLKSALTLELVVKENLLIIVK